jgi:hypothetical protein
MSAIASAIRSSTLGLGSDVGSATISDNFGSGSDFGGITTSESVSFPTLVSTKVAEVSSSFLPKG